MHRSGRSNAVRRAGLLASVIGALAALCLLALPAAAGANTQTYPPNGNKAYYFTVPNGVEYLRLALGGGAGGSETVNYQGPGQHLVGDTEYGGGAGGLVKGVFPVVPGQVFTVYVATAGAGHGGTGWAPGGTHGTTPAGSGGKDGSGGGGASAIFSNSKTMLIAGGGGGGGGFSFVGSDGNMAYAGTGGDAGQPGNPGWQYNGRAFLPGDPMWFPNTEGRTGGCAACRKTAYGYEGESTIGAQIGGAGGGGGGGAVGGDGGSNGFYSYRFFAMYIGGSGGGGGSNYISSSALEPSQGLMPYGQNGAVTISWAGAPTAITPSGGGQSTVVTSDFAPMTATVTDSTDVPVPNETVNFAAPPAGVTGYFPDGGTQSHAVTDVNGQVTVPPLLASGTAGNWTLQASLADQPSVNAGFSMTNAPADTTTVLSINPSPSYLGQTVTYSAVVSSKAPGVIPTGPVEFSFDGNPSVASVPVGPDGKATLPAADVPPLGVGTHPVKAAFQGDTSHNVSQDVESQVVSRMPTTVAVTSAPNPSSFQQDVLLTATVTGANDSNGPPTGTLTFSDSNGATIGTQPLDGSGEAQITTDDLPLGSSTVTASYAGDAKFLASSGRMVESVGPEATATIISTSANPVVYGSRPTWTATVRRSDQGLKLQGTVAFKLDGTTVCPAAPMSLQGQVSCTAPSASDAGIHAVEADYEPLPADATGDDPSLGILDQVVLPAPSRTVASVTPEQSVFGQPTDLSATVSLLENPAQVPTGDASFLIDGNVAGSLALSAGQATRAEDCSAAPGTCHFSVGSHIVEAAYGPAGPNIQSSHAAVLHRVTPAPTSLVVSSSSDPSSNRSPATFTAKVTASPATGPPSGHVLFVVDGVIAGTTVPLSGGEAESQPIRGLSQGVHVVTARYLGTPSFVKSEATLRQRVEGSDEPDLGVPGFVFPGSRARLSRRGSMKIDVNCVGAPGTVCRGLSVVRNRNGSHQMLAQRALVVKGGTTVARRFDLNSYGIRVFRARKSVQSLVRVLPQPGTARNTPHKLKVFAKARLRPAGGRR